MGEGDLSKDSRGTVDFLRGSLNKSPHLCACARIEWGCKHCRSVLYHRGLSPRQHLVCNAENGAQGLAHKQVSYHTFLAFFLLVLFFLPFFLLFFLFGGSLYVDQVGFEFTM